MNKNYTNYILNDKNVLITREYIISLLTTYGIPNYNITDINLFYESTTHSSYLINAKIDDKFKLLVSNGTLKCIDNKQVIKNKIVQLRINSYERLEFLGDSVLHMVLGEYLFIRYPEQDEGFMTNLRTKIENGEYLASLARHINLHKYALLAQNIELIGGRQGNNHIFEDVFEAFLGCLYVDSGYNYNICKTFVVNCLESHFDFSLSISQQCNYKDTLLKHYHSKKWKAPSYVQLSCITENGKSIPTYTMGVYDDNNNIIGSGTSTSKKKAEQLASQQALYKLGLVNDETEDNEEIYE